MVALAELNNMFWGVTLDGGKHYTQTVERSFHISMAALEVSTSKDGPKSGDFVSIMIQHEKAEFVLCTLRHGHILQQPLDLNFTPGEEITFFLNGKGIVHLTGYLTDDPGDDDVDYSDMSMEGATDEESEEADSEDEAPQLTKARLMAVNDDDSDDSDDEDFVQIKGKRKKQDVVQKSAKKFKANDAEEDSEEDSDDDDDDDEVDTSDLDSDDLNFLDEEALEDSDFDDDDDDDESEDEEELARMSGSFLQAIHKVKATPKSDKPTPGKGKETPKGKDVQKGKDTPKSKDTQKSKDTPKSKETPKSKDIQKGKDTPKGGEGKKQTPKVDGKKSMDTPKQGVNEASPAQNDSTSSKKKKKKRKKNKNKEEGAGDAATPQQKAGTPGGQKAGTPGGQKAGTPGGQKPGTPADSQKAKSPGSAQKAKKAVLEGGVICQDQKEGHGPTATNGKMVHVHYTGRLEKSGKIFDQNSSGKPFKFKLGKSEVIRGWDVGVKGMKVGGKRKLIIPAKMAYGNQKIEMIPPNSTLMFDVELKSVS